MALDKTTLAAAIQAVFEDVSEGATAADKAAQLADAFDAYVRSGTVNFAAGSITGEDDPSGDTHDALSASGGTIE